MFDILVNTAQNRLRCEKADCRVSGSIELLVVGKRVIHENGNNT